VSGGVNAYSDGYLENGVGTDEFMRLCDIIGMTPALTVRLQYGTDEEIQDAVDWVEYCNGDAVSTKMGSLRAARGHVEPYNVRYWYLGNEMNLQARFPNYPSSLKHDPPPSASEYSHMIQKLAAAMHAVDPNIQFFAVEGGDLWDQQWMKSRVVNSTVATSFHGGYATMPGGTPHTAKEFTMAAGIPSGSFLTNLQAKRLLLDASAQASGVSPVGISCDEWGLGPPWTVDTFNVAHGMYAANFLGVVMRNAARLGIKFTNYFEPINEGALSVGPTRTKVTPLGEVLKLYSQHQGRMRINGYSDNPDLDVIASVKTSQSNSDEAVMFTIANRNASSQYQLRVLPQGRSETLAATCSLVLLTPKSFQTDSEFFRNETIIPIAVDGTIEVNIPAYSIVHAAVPMHDDS